jgi:DNA helicase II / ATP-dependent DNA helicase PcrA
VERVVEALKARIDQVAEDDLSWTQVCDRFEGRDAVALMTVHKSKGLEYHTVFFLSIDDRQWWSFRREQASSTSTFFVGSVASRATDDLHLLRGARRSRHGRRAVSASRDRGSS